MQVQLFLLCTDSSDQEAIPLSKVHPDIHQLAIVLAGIECIERTGQVGFCPDK